MNECYTSDDEDADLLDPSFVSSNSGRDQGTKSNRIKKTLLINISFVALVGIVIEQRKKTITNNKNKRILMLIHNITICNIYIYIQGLCGSVLGPTLLDLRDLLDTTISSMSLLFIVRSIGAITGSFSGNKIFKICKLNSESAISTLALTMFLHLLSV